MILIALGANLPSPLGPPRVTLEAALDRLGELSIQTVKRSGWYRTSPVPPSGQPDFVNGVAAVETDLGPKDLLKTLHDVETELGRTRRERWEARVIDLDLLAYHDELILERLQKSGQSIQIPHPRLYERRFVLAPLAEIAPDWAHPTLGKSAAELLMGLESAERVEIIDY